MNLDKTMTFNSDFTYQFYPCGYIPTRADNQLLWVRYKTQKERAKASKFFEASATALGVYIDTPDRELYFDRAGHMSNHDRPLRNWDKCVSLGLHWATSNDIPGDRFMINHTSYTSRDHKMRLRSDFPKHIQTKKIVICDSGGFQLRSGKESWIDPEGLAKFYTDYVDEGVTLDIPIPTYNRELLTRMLKVQENNSKVLLENVGPDVRLANVAHGLDYNDFMFVRENLWEDERMDMLCIPSSVMMPELKSIDRLLYHITHGMKYRQYHLLGIYQTSWLSIAIKAVVEYNKISGRKPILLTSDASSGIYSANALRYHRQPVPYRSVARWAIGTVVEAGGHQHSPHNTLTCQCMVCSNVKYTDVFKLAGDINTSTWLTRHNEQETIRWARMMEDAAIAMPTKDYIQFCLTQIPVKGKNSVIEAFKYLEMFLQEGWEATHKKFKHKLATLFNAPRKQSLYEVGHDGLAENENVTTLHKHLDDVLRRYERFHKTGKRPTNVGKKGKIIKGVGNAGTKTSV
jgi:hypothetical protein